MLALSAASAVSLLSDGVFRLASAYSPALLGGIAFVLSTSDRNVAVAIRSPHPPLYYVAVIPCPITPRETSGRIPINSRGHRVTVLLLSNDIGAVSLQNDVLASGWIKKVHESPEVITFRGAQHCPSLSPYVGKAMSAHSFASANTADITTRICRCVASLITVPRWSIRNSFLVNTTVCLPSGNVSCHVHYSIAGWLQTYSE